VVSACATTPEVPYTLDVPALSYLYTAPGFEDERARFREILCAVDASHGDQLPDHRPCGEILHRFADEPAGTGRPVALGAPLSNLRIALVSGFGAQCFEGLVQAFSASLAHLESHGYRTTTIEVDGLSSSANNGRQIAEAVAAMDLAAGERVLLIGYSKGAVDIQEGLVAHPELQQRVAAFVTVAGAIYGSPLSEDAPESLLPLLAHLPGSQCEVGDRGALNSLEPDVRRRFALTQHLPAGIRTFCLGTFADRSHISFLLRNSYDELARIDPRNDGQVLFYDQILREGALLGFADADHWAIALPLARDHPTLGSTLAGRNEFPREVVLEAIVRLVEEQLAANR
jgi:hypothetical protein